MIKKTMGELSKEMGYNFNVNPRMNVSTWCKRMGVPSLGKVYDKLTQQKPENGKWKSPTACTGKCSLKYNVKSNTIEGKLDYIIQLLEGLNLEAKKQNLRHRLNRIPTTPKED